MRNHMLPPLLPPLFFVLIFLVRALALFALVQSRLPPLLPFLLVVLLFLLLLSHNMVCLPDRYIL
jgi:hypothetical protein